MDKSLIKASCLDKIKSQIQELKNILNQTLIATATDAKSSAGDKHETSVSMAQLEQEKLTHQINVLQAQYETLININTTTKNTSVRLGSLVETSMGWFYIATGIGKFTYKKVEIFAMNNNAPLAQKMVGKSKAEIVIHNNSKIEILNIY
jgi:hypothetical protein